MKKIILFILAYFISFQLFSQLTMSQTDSLAIEMYLHRSKRQKTAGSILIATGVTSLCVAGGLALEDMSHWSFNIMSGITSPREPVYQDHSGLIWAFLITGIGTTIAGTGLISKSKYNKTIALDLIGERVSMLRANSMICYTIPAIGIRWRF